MRVCNCACACVLQGDAVEIVIITKEGLRREQLPLKLD